MRWHKLAQKETPFVVSGSGSLGPVQRRVNRRMAGFVGGGASREWVLKRQDELRKRQDELDGEPGGFVGDPKNPQFGS